MLRTDIATHMLLLLGRKGWRGTAGDYFGVAWTGSGGLGSVGASGAGVEALWRGRRRCGSPTPICSQASIYDPRALHRHGGPLRGAAGSRTIGRTGAVTGEHNAAGLGRGGRFGRRQGCGLGWVWAEIGLFLPFLANDAGAATGGGVPWVVLAAVYSRLASVMDSYAVRRPVGHSPVCCDAAIGGGAEDGSGHDSRDGGWLKLSSTHDHRAALCV